MSKNIKKEKEEDQDDEAMKNTGGGGYNGHETGEGTLINPVFFPNYRQLQQQNNGFGDFGMDMNLSFDQFVAQGGFAFNPFLPVSNPFDIFSAGMLQLPVLPPQTVEPQPFQFPHRQKAPAQEKAAAEKEVDDFLDQILMDRLNGNSSSGVATPLKKSRPSSPLPSSTPKAPRAMIELASQDNPRRPRFGNAVKVVNAKKGADFETLSKKASATKDPEGPGIIQKPAVKKLVHQETPKKIPQAAVPKGSHPCYNCNSQEHNFEECTKKCPHCDKDGHKPHHCDYRTMIDGTKKIRGFNNTACDDDTMEKRADKHKVGNGINHAAKKDAKGVIKTDQLAVVSKDLVKRTTNPKKPINLSSADSENVGRKHEKKGELRERGRTRSSPSREATRRPDLYTPYRREFHGDMGARLSEEEQREEWRRYWDREVGLQRRSRSPERGNRHRYHPSEEEQREEWRRHRDREVEIQRRSRSHERDNRYRYDPSARKRRF